MFDDQLVTTGRKHGFWAEELWRLTTFLDARVQLNVLPRPRAGPPRPSISKSDPPENQTRSDGASQTGQKPPSTTPRRPSSSGRWALMIFEIGVHPGWSWLDAGIGREPGVDRRRRNCSSTSLG